MVAMKLFSLETMELRVILVLVTSLVRVTVWFNGKKLLATSGFLADMDMTRAEVLAT